MTYTGVRVSRGRRGPSRNLRLLVDTGADFTVLPAGLLAQLGVKPEFEEEIEVGNGEVIVRPVGRMYVRWKDRSAETLVAFGEPRDARVLGAYALQGLRLEVDPASHRVRPRRRALFLRFGGLTGQMASLSQRESLGATVTRRLPRRSSSSRAG